MSRFFYVFILVLIGAASALGQIAGAGRSFVLTLPYGSTASKYYAPIPRLLLTSEAPATVQLLFTETGATQNVSIPPGGSQEVQIDSALVMLPAAEGTFDNTVQITSDVPITAAFVLDRHFAAEAYAPLPDSILGFEYIAVGTDEGEDRGMVVVVGIHDSTTVTITPSVPTLGRRPRGVPFTVVLDRGEVFQLLSEPYVDIDITGTTILADKPCGVLSGSVCADFVVGEEHRCNPLIEQLPHVDSWGREFVVGPLERSPLGLFRFVARCSGTTITINDQVVATLNRGEYYRVLLDTIYRVRASQPVLAAQMVVSTSQGIRDRSVPYGDPSMAVVPPVDQWAPGYRFVVPQLAYRQDAGEPTGWRHFLQVSFPASAESGIRIDGVPPAWITRMMKGSDIIGIAELEPGRHSVDAESRIGAITYGYSVSDAYGYAPGSIVRGYRLEAAPLRFGACAATFDTTITIRNSDSGDAVIDEVEVIGDIEGELIAPASLPITVPGGDSVRLTIRFRNLGAAVRSGHLVLWGGACRSRLLALQIDAVTSQLLLAPAAGSTIDFGVIPSTIPSVDRIITLTNSGLAPIVVPPPQVIPAEFTIVSPSFPLRLEAGASAQVTIRFAAATDGRRFGSATFTIAECPDTHRIALVAERKEGGYLGALLAEPVRVLCPPKGTPIIELSLINLGNLPIDLTDGTLIGDHAGEFQLMAPLAGRSIAPGDTLKARVRYLPDFFGPRNVALEVTSNAINGGTFYLPIDVRNDTLRLEADVTLIDFGSVLPCDAWGSVDVTIANRGTVPIPSLSAFVKTAGLGAATPGSGSIAVGESLRIRVELSPAASGAIQDSLIVQSPLCDYRLAIPLRGDRAGTSISASFSTDTLDFGVLTHCLRDRELRAVLRNDGAVFDTIRITHLPSGAALTFTPFEDPLILSPGGKREIALRYHPTTASSLADSLTIISQPCSLVRTLHLKGSFDPGRPVLSNGSIDFGDVTVGVAARRTVMIVNTSGLDYRLGPGAFAPAGGVLRLIRPQADTIIGPGDSIEVELEYLPVAAGDTLSSALAVPVLAPCGDTLILFVRGVAIEERARLGLRWEGGSAEVGEEISIWLEVMQGSAPIMNDTLLLRTELRFDASVLFPIAIAGVNAVAARTTGERFEGSERIIEIEARGLFPATGRIAEARMLATLGASDSTWLSFESATAERSATGAPIVVRDTVPGIFRMLGICRVGTARLLVPSGLLRLSAPRPNPTIDMARLELELIERGRTRLLLSDVKGSNAATLFDREMSPGTYRIEIDARHLPSGLYLLRLETPTQVMGRKMVIVK